VELVVGLIDLQRPAGNREKLAGMSQVAGSSSSGSAWLQPPRQRDISLIQLNTYQLDTAAPLAAD